MELALAQEPKAKPNPFAAFLKKQSEQKRPSRDLSGRESGNTVVASRSRSSFASSRSRRPAPVVVTRSRGASAGGESVLPGVDERRAFAIEDDEESDAGLFGFGRKSNKRGQDRDFDESVRVAAVTNMARRGSHGLLLQRPDVQVGCFPAELVRLLKQVERKFGRTPIVTSGYRSPNHNKRVRGARKSQHMLCGAADIQVQGISKWTLAKYLRSLPGRGGVGTYCHTKSVHIDIGKERDWNRRCARKRA